MQQTVYKIKNDPWSSHAVISRWLREFPVGTRILDVGSASGMFGRMVAGAGLELYGLEPNQDWAATAQPYYRQVVASTLDAVDRAYLKDFQVVVCGDVLEHLPDPLVKLTGLVQLQPPGAVFITSMPNIANFWVRLNLLAGRFDYTDSGILDRTHLRFYTLRTMRDLVTAAGLRINRTVPTPIPLNIVHPFFENNKAGRALHALLNRMTCIFPGLMGYQFVMYAEKP